MLVDNATPELPIKNKDVKGDEVDKLNEKLLQFKKIAQRKVPWFSPLCFLVPSTRWVHHNNKNRLRVCKPRINYKHLMCHLSLIEIIIKLWIVFFACKTTEVATQIKLIVEPQSENELLDLYSQTFLKDYKGEWSLGCKLGWPLLNVFCSKCSCHCHLVFMFGWSCPSFPSPPFDPKEANTTLPL